MKKPVTVTITGAAGNIGYALAFRVASGQMLGPDQPINLNLLEIPAAQNAVQGVVMELNDCAFPTLNKVVASDDAMVAFKDCNFAMLVGARPRHGAQGSPSRERKDIFRTGQGLGCGREPRRASAGRRQSGEHELADRPAQRPLVGAATIQRDDAFGP